jgi:hypothetical protein
VGTRNTWPVLPHCPCGQAKRWVTPR